MPATPTTTTMLRTTLATLGLALLASCTTTHTHSVAYNGVPGIRGEPVEFQSTTRYALHLLFIFGVLGDASQDATVDAFTKEASGRGASALGIRQGRDLIGKSQHDSFPVPIHARGSTPGRFWALGAQAMCHRCKNGSID